MTLLYEFYYDLVMGGTYTKQIHKMHETYGEDPSRLLRGVTCIEQQLIYFSLLLAGPLVRISPNEIHCNDAAFVDEIYASGARKRDKQAHYLGVLAGPTTRAAFGTADHDLHRVRRNAMNKFFSHAQITRLEPEIATLVQLLCEKLLSMTSPVLEKKSYVDVSIF